MSSAKFRKRNSGFTLIEFAIVIVMASILASVATPIYFGFTDGAKWTEAKTVAGTLKRQIDVHKAKTEGSILDLAEGDGTTLSFDKLRISKAVFTSLQYFDPKDFLFTYETDGTDGNYIIYVDASIDPAGGLSNVGPESGTAWYKSIDNSWNGEFH